MRVFVRFAAVGLLSVIFAGCGVSHTQSIAADPPPTTKAAVDPPYIEHNGSEPKFPNRVYTAIVFEPSTLPMTVPQPLEVVFFSTFSRNISATVSVSLTTSGVLTLDPPTVAKILVPGLGSGILTTTFKVDHEGFDQIIAFVTVEPILTATDRLPCPMHYEYAVSTELLASKIGIFTSTDDYLVAAVEHQIITPDERDAIQQQRRNGKEHMLMGVDGPLDDPPSIDVPISQIPDC